MGDVEFVEPPNWGSWVRGFKDLGRKAAAADTARTMALNLFFARTQQYVHIISGDLKRSGKVTKSWSGGVWVGEVQYGSTDVDYAHAEIARGGSHDFVGRAWESTEAIMAKAIGSTWGEITDSWR